MALLTSCTGATGRPSETPSTGPSNETLPPGATISPTGEGLGYEAFCGNSPACPSGSVPAAFRRPLRLPKVRSGEPCPVSPARTVAAEFAPALGGGPVYPVIGGRGPRGTVMFEFPPPADTIFAGSGFGGQQVVWIADPAYRGPALVRGRQLDGPHPVGFGHDRPLPELQLPPAGQEASSAWRPFGVEVRLRAAGCYAWQVDGTDFTKVIVFNARIGRS